MRFIDRLGQRAEWKDLDLRLLRRITLGMTASDVTAVKAIGFDRYLEEQLTPSSIDDTACDTRIATRYPQFAYSQATLLAKESVFWNEVVAPVQRAIVERGAFSKRQLQERMTEFWTDHFNIANSPPRLVDYRDVIRQHALGNFGDMVRASMRSPAMLIYLDQVWSTKWGVNENYARELMELHTVGWNGGYTQQDVHELARVLTGWTIDGNRNFLYRADYHDFGAKTVMGVDFPARPQAGGTAGMDEAMTFAEFLINHPATARHIATKLLRWFIRPDPTNTQINAVAAAYTATGGDIKAMLRAVLTRNNLANAPAKLKRPFHYYVSALRTTGVTVDPWSDWNNSEGGGAPLGPGAPDLRLADPRRLSRPRRVLGGADGQPLECHVVGGGQLGTAGAVSALSPRFHGWGRRPRGRGRDQPAHVRRRDDHVAVHRTHALAAGEPNVQ
ncbi:MAG: DUF1800 domain-containing protein [Gemmatimonadetes bacterium]|nr:DUF1800 domain-containing protein [Gemmatimonadota bacterium]